MYDVRENFSPEVNEHVTNSIIFLQTKLKLLVIGNIKNKLKG